MVPRFGCVMVLVMVILGGEVLGQDLAKGWAWSGIATATLENQAGPAPAPGPAPSGTCETCSGTGKVGDGRVFQICKDCNGTGKITAAPAPVPPPTPAAKPKATTFKKVCIDGQCQWVPVEEPQPSAVLQEDKPQVICEGGYCYPAPAQPRVQQRVKRPSIFSGRGFFYRRQ